MCEPGDGPYSTVIYAVDYYFMNYTAHFFALILPRKMQYCLIKAATQKSACLCRPILINQVSAHTADKAW